MSQVILRVSPYALQEAFRLPEGVSLVSAGTERLIGSPPGHVLVLTIDFPGAPEGAAAVDPVYSNQGRAGWLRLDGFIWQDAGGSEITRTWDGLVAELADTARVMGTVITVLPPGGSDASPIEIDGRPAARA